MINKVELQSVINKYYLNGLVEGVKWDIKGNILNIKFTSPTKEMIGEINYTKFDIQDSSIGISNTSQLLKLLGIMSGDIMLNYIQSGKICTKLIIADNQFTVNYALADMMTIPRSGKYSGGENYNIETELNEDIINSLIKAKSALAESTTVLLKPFSSLDGDTQLEMVFGGDIEYANKVSFYLSNLKCENLPNEFEIGFNSDLFKEILNCNKDATKAILYINIDGLMKLIFETDTTKSIYYLVKKEL